MQLRFQNCTTSDLDKLVEISKRTFVESFEKDNDPEDFNTYINKAFEKSNIEQQLQNSDSSFCFVYVEDALAGYFKLNQNAAQTDIKSEESLELERIYVAQEFQGKRIGQHMLQEVLKIGAQENKKFLWLGVWENNQHAIRFYERHGFTKFDTHPYYIGKDEQTDWLMRVDLINFQES